MPTPPEPPEAGPEAGPGAAVRLLCDTAARAADPSPAHGVLWKLAEPGRQLDANLVRLDAGRHIATHAEPDLDVLLLVVAGDGRMDTGDGHTATGGTMQPLAAGALLWLPRGSSRSITAGPDGLTYLTAHGRRPGMRIGSRAPEPR